MNWPLKPGYLSESVPPRVNNKKFGTAWFALIVTVSGSAPLYLIKAVA